MQYCFDQRKHPQKRCAKNRIKMKKIPPSAVFHLLVHTKHCTCQSFYLIDRIEPYLCSEKVCKGNISWCSFSKTLGFKTMDVEEWLWLQWQSRKKWEAEIHNNNKQKTEQPILGQYLKLYLEIDELVRENKSPLSMPRWTSISSSIFKWCAARIASRAFRYSTVCKWARVFFR